MTEKARLLEAGLIGWPIEHSLSPAVHTYWMQQKNINGRYLLRPTRADDVKDTVDFIRQEGWRGFNVTSPLKEIIVDHLDHVDDIARRLRAVNTVICNSQGQLHGTNSDLHGFSANLKNCSFLPPTRKKAVLFGAGGAARAVLVALEAFDFSEILVLNWVDERAGLLVDQLKVKTARPVEWSARHTALDGADLLVNASSAGMGDNDPLPLDLAALPAQALVHDIVYKPVETPLLSDARARGNPVLDGIGMLLYQAQTGFKAWFDPESPVPDVDTGLRDKIQLLLSEQGRG